MTAPRLALVVDEAQSVPYELLEEIRLLTNAEANGPIAGGGAGRPARARRSGWMKPGCGN